MTSRQPKCPTKKQRGLFIVFSLLGFSRIIFYDAQMTGRPAMSYFMSPQRGRRKASRKRSAPYPPLASASFAFRFARAIAAGVSAS